MNLFSPNFNISSVNQKFQIPLPFQFILGPHFFNGTLLKFTLFGRETKNCGLIGQSVA